jgi:hypothetical protein
MAFEHYIIVRDSDLYEYKGLAKPVLLTIAHLIREEPEENEQGKVIGKPHPNAGWCDAGQDYIAAALGMSSVAVSCLVNTMRKDGWLEVETRRNRFGHPYNKYRIPADKLKEIKARTYKKDEQGKIIRGVQINKARKLGRGDKGRFLTAPSRKASTIGQSYGDPIHALGTSESRVASRHGGEELDVTVARSLTSTCGEPHVTVASVVGLSRLNEHVLVAGEKKHTLHTGADKTKTKTNPNTQILSGQGFVVKEELPPVQTHRGVAPNPTEASRLETPGTDLSPVGATPVPRPPLPAFHYTHKWRTQEGRLGKRTSCEFCGCMRDSKNSTKPCRPDSWIPKEQVESHTLSQAAIVLAAMAHGIPDLHKVVLV